MKAIEIFRAGTHTASDGRTLEFSEAIVQALVDAYDPSVHEAPIVCGHPTRSDAPAYGWVKALSKVGSGVVAEPQQLNPEFAEMVAGGSFKKVSASFYLPGAAGNPKPDGYYLRHVGFLGAAPPAIKGLRQVEFAGATEGFVTLEFGEADRSIGVALRLLRDWVIGKFGLEEADKALPPWTVDHIAETAIREESTTNYAEPLQSGSAPAATTPPVATPAAQGSAAEDDQAEPPTRREPTSPPPASDSPKQAELDAREAALKAREAKLAEDEKARRLAGHRDFCERLVKQGRLLPRSAEHAVSFMQILSGETVDFGAAEKRSALDIFKEEFLAQLPRQVDFKERAPAELGDEREDEDPRVLAEKIVAFREQEAKAGRFVSTSEAARIIRST